MLIIGDSHYTKLMALNLDMVVDNNRRRRRRRMLKYLLVNWWLLTGTNLFYSFVNISVIAVIADKKKKKHSLGKFMQWKRYQNECVRTGRYYVKWNPIQND